MWKLIINQSGTTEYGYDAHDAVEFIADDIRKLTGIIEYVSNMNNKKTEYIIRKEEEQE
ncbi:MAG: hypothetical protein IKW21_06640 [Lachnospiraceae bacterium]|nr:hypothetical protein [Lachnospiraceae bacterium]